MVTTTEKKNIGYLRQVIGPVVDVEFPNGELPKIYNALAVEGKNEMYCPLQSNIRVRIFSECVIIVF